MDNKTNPGGQSALTKINADGSYGWTKLSGSLSAVAVDQSDNVFMAGYYNGTIDFDPSGGTDSRTSNGNADSFLTKINADGTYGWTRTFGGTGGDYINSIAVDSGGDVFMAGSFAGTADFDPSVGTDNKTSNGSDDIFLTKINADGTYGWSRTMGGAEDSDGAIDVAVDNDGNVFIAGYFYSDGAPLIDFDPTAGTDNHTSNGDTYNFLTKINADGTYGWTRVIPIDGNWRVMVETNSSGAVYIAGEFSDTVDFDSTGGTDNHTGAGWWDTYVTKFNADGTYGYTKTIGGASSGANPTGLFVDDSDNLYVSGDFRISPDFDPGVGTDTKTSVGFYSAYVTRLNDNGSYSNTQIFTGSGSVNGYGVTARNNGSLYIAGYFSGTADFDPTTGVDNKTSSGSTDFFLTKLTQTTYQQITGLAPSLAAKTLSDVDATDNTITNGTSATIRLSLSDTTPIADVTTTFTTDLDWSTVTADSNPTTGTAFAHNLTAADGTAGTFTLYVPKLPNHTRVGICPGANSLAATTEQCEGLYYLTEGVDNNLTTTTIDNQDYWTITGLTGTGGFSAEAAATTTTDTTDTEALAETGDSGYVGLAGALILTVMGLLVLTKRLYIRQ